MASKKRVICGLSVAAVWLVLIFTLPISVLALLITAATGMCLYELSSMLKKAGYALPFGTLMLATVIWFLLRYAVLAQCPGWTMILAAQPVVLGVLCMLLFFRVEMDKRIERPMETAALTVVSFLYLPFMLTYLLEVAMSPLFMQEWTDATGEVLRSYTPGIFVAFFLALVTKLSDTGGYFIGSAFGKHKMCPRLSPGKSWEGTAGGYAFSLIGAGIVVALAAFTDLSWLEGIRALCTRDGAFQAGPTIWLFVTVCGIVTVGILGDLLESLFKRQCGVKDSSALFPAMGGFFDTFDSLIFVPVTFLFLAWIGLQIF